MPMHVAEPELHVCAPQLIIVCSVLLWFGCILISTISYATVLCSAQRIAEQMQESNPELMEQVRQQMSGQGGGAPGAPGPGESR